MIDSPYFLLILGFWLLTKLLISVCRSPLLIWVVSPIPNINAQVCFSPHICFKNEALCTNFPALSHSQYNGLWPSLAFPVFIVHHSHSNGHLLRLRYIYYWYTTCLLSLSFSPCILLIWHHSVPWSIHYLFHALITNVFVGLPVSSISPLYLMSSLHHTTITHPPCTLSPICHSEHGPFITRSPDSLGLAITDHDFARNIIDKLEGILTVTNHSYRLHRSTSP